MSWCLFIMKIYKQLFWLTAITFLLHFVWENSQAPLYEGYSSFSQHLPICFWGVIGDTIFTLVVYLGIGLLKNDFQWLTKLGLYDIIVLAVIGFFAAIGIEWRALLFNRWTYVDAMPLLPYFQVGLIPVLQMTLLLPLSFYLTSKLNKITTPRHT